MLHGEIDPGAVAVGSGGLAVLYTIWRRIKADFKVDGDRERVDDLHDMMTAQLEWANKRYQEGQQAINDMAHQRNEARIEAAKSQSEVVRLSEELARAVRDYSKLDEQNVALAADHAKLKADHEALRQAFRRLNKHLGLDERDPNNAR